MFCASEEENKMQGAQIVNEPTTCKQHGGTYSSFFYYYLWQIVQLYVRPDDLF